jgi:membrane fusion protein (multidrug efflux system)
MFRNKIRNKRRAIPNFFILLVLAVGIGWTFAQFIHWGNVEFTDNAQVKQHLTPVNTRVQGFIKRICFEEYQHVKKGDTLVVIEDTEYRLKVAQAEADYRSALAGKTAMYTTINTTQNNILVTDAAIEEQRVRLKNAEADYKRYQGLLKEEAVTPQQFDRVKTDYEATKARYEQLLRQKQSTSLVKQEQTQRLDQNESSIKLAEAALDLARLNLSYTVILATADGVTGRKDIHEGELVQPGQTLVTLVDGAEKWVIANYKETQTTRMQQGQLVDIKVDALPGIDFEGRISSISDATGSFYSLIPQDNSAGNFVKVEQRIPVRIEFTDRNRKEDLERLRAGMNVECTVSF